MGFIAGIFEPTNAIQRSILCGWWSSNPAEQVVAAQLDRATMVAAAAQQKSEPHVRPVVQSAGALGGALQVAGGAAIVVVPQDLGLGDGFGVVLIVRGEDVLGATTLTRTQAA